MRFFSGRMYVSLRSRHDDARSRQELCRSLNDKILSWPLRDGHISGM